MAKSESRGAYRGGAYEKKRVSENGFENKNPKGKNMISIEKVF